jgi:hypothetical protein
MTSFANLKRNSNSFEKLSKAVEATSAGTENSKDDNRFWQPEVDKAGNGMAIIRFLPAPAVDGDVGQEVAVVVLSLYFQLTPLVVMGESLLLPVPMFHAPETG